MQNIKITSEKSVLNIFKDKESTLYQDDFTFTITASLRKIPPQIVNKLLFTPCRFIFKDYELLVKEEMENNSKTSHISCYFSCNDFHLMKVNDISNAITSLYEKYKSWNKNVKDFYIHCINTIMNSVSKLIICIETSDDNLFLIGVYEEIYQVPKKDYGKHLYEIIDEIKDKIEIINSAQKIAPNAINNFTTNRLDPVELTKHDSSFL